MPVYLTPYGQLVMIDGRVPDVQIVEEPSTDTSYFAFNDLTQTITGYNFAGGLDVNIPKTINGLQVLHIGANAFKGIAENKLVAISIPEGVVSIGDNAFADNALTSVILPNTIENIGMNAFSGNNITVIVVSSTIATMGEGVLESNYLSGISIPPSITAIPANAFADNNLKSIALPSTVASVGSGSFALNDITSITIENGIDIIDSTSMGTYGDSFKTTYEAEMKESGVYEYVAGGWVNKKPKPTTQYTPEIYFSFDLQSQTITAYDWTNGPRAVSIPPKIANVDVLHIGDMAFQGDPKNGNSLTSLVLPNTIETIGVDAFSNNDINSVTLPESLRIIGNSSFANCSYLSHVSFPSYLELIDNAAFGSCNLVNIELNQVDRINQLAFYGNSVSSITLPQDCLLEHEILTLRFKRAYDNNGKQAGVYTCDGFDWYLDGSPIDPFLHMIDFDFDLGKIYAYDGPNINGSLTLPDMIGGCTVQIIGEYVFAEKGITDVVLPNGLSIIEPGAFQYNSISGELDIPTTVTSIGSGAFRNNSLTNLSLPNGVVGIESQCFAYNALVDVHLPSTVNFIGWGAFEGNDIVGITIGSGVTIEESATSFGTFSEAFVTLYNSNQVYGFYAYENDVWYLTAT